MDSNLPVVIYLHGVGDGDPVGSWRQPLDDALRDLGYPSLGDKNVRIHAPRYPHSLNFPQDDEPRMPPRTVPKLSRAEEETHRRAYERRLAEFEATFGEHTAGRTSPLIDALGGPALNAVQQARRYVKDSGVRAAVLTRILKAAPTKGDALIIGHSLGSLIAIDLLDHLPPDLHVRGLVTIGSPAGHPALQRRPERLLPTFPLSRIDWWVNFWNAHDAVSGFRGVSHLFPAALDTRLDLGQLTHRAAAFTASPLVATAVGRGVFGSQSKEIVPLQTAPDIRLNDVELFLLLALSYAHFVGDNLDGSAGERWRAALQIVQVDLIEKVLAHYRETGQLVPDALSRCRNGERPPPISQLAKDDSISSLIQIATSNVLVPFEIKVSADVQKRALHDCTVAMGLGGTYGRHVSAAIVEATKAVSADDDWKRWAVIGGGALLLVLGPAALVMAAPAGLAGAAAITSALAAFGPGGMIGGLMTVGALTTTGASTVAAALASSDSSAEAVEQVVVQLVAAAIVRDREGLVQDEGIWLALTELEHQVVREIQRLEPYSDSGSASVKALRRKADAVSRAMRFLTERAHFASIAVEGD